MSILIIICLVLFIAVELAHLYTNGYIYRRNLSCYQQDIDHLNKRLSESQENNFRLSKELLELKNVIEQTKLRGFYQLGFALTPDGIRALPDGWQEALERLKDSRL